MATATDVAIRLLELARQETEPEPITQLRLQKLTYYAQGWSLAVRQKPLFTEDFQAWAHGPALPSLYAKFKQFGAEPIKLEATDTCRLTKQETDFVKEIWETFRSISGVGLMLMTHGEWPWLKARGELKSGEASAHVIPKEDMRHYFASVRQGGV